MKYDISKTTPPAMPRLGHDTECIALLLSQVSKDMQQPIAPMLFSPLGAHLSGAQFMYPDLSWKESCGMLAKISFVMPLHHQSPSQGFPQAAPPLRLPIATTLLSQPSK